MLVRFLLSFILSAILFSCKPNYQEQILGEWKYVGLGFKENGIERDYNSEYKSFKYSSYQFFRNDSCEERSPASVSRGFYDFNTRYKVDGDNLRIFSLNEWRRMTILRMSGDTMLIESPDFKKNNLYYKYVRQHYVDDPSLKFDQIMVSYGAWSTRSELSIDKYGRVTYCHNSLRQDYYLTSKISENAFAKIELAFAKANFLQLKDRYEDSSSDNLSVEISLVKDGKILKTTYDIDVSGPAELMWAYTPLLAMKGYLKMDTLHHNSMFNHFFKSFANASGIHRLRSTESFYLWNLLWKGNKVSKQFSKKYDVKFDGDSKILNIETDGRLYRFNMENGTKYTYDIGFNFIERNSDKMKFEDKTSN